MVSAANAEDLDALITLMGPDTLKNTIYLARYSLYPVLEMCIRDRLPAILICRE